jgi:hypothetical protein
MDLSRGLGDVYKRQMLALVVIDHVLQHRAQCGDVVQPASS